MFNKPIIILLLEVCYMSELIIDPQVLKNTCTKLFKKAGVPDRDAHIISEVLVVTEMRGVRSHGVMRLEHYIRCILEKGINPKAEITIERENHCWALVNGNGGLGIVISYKAMNLAISKAKEYGVGVVNVNNSHHFGAAGYYSMMCAKKGMIGISMSNGDIIMAITGGSKKSIGNNPFSFAVPAGKYRAVMLDIAMSKVADGKIQIARALGKPVPEGSILDINGNPSTDPQDYFNGGTLLPFGDYKGYGLAVMVECLAGVLSNAAITSDIRAWNKDPNRTGNTGHFFAAIDIEKIMPLDVFTSRMELLCERLQSSPKAKDVDRILLPGQLEIESEERVKANGIPLLNSCVETLYRTADKLGVDISL
jgi:LDH2 family malate/lactate/ureidoglycolate dehydrogenase